MSHSNQLILHCHPKLDSGSLLNLCHPERVSGSYCVSAPDSGSKPGMTVQYVILNLIQAHYSTFVILNLIQDLRGHPHKIPGQSPE
jgi:hypothetical protein